MRYKRNPIRSRAGGKRKMNKMEKGVALFSGVQILKPALERLFNEAKSMMIYTIRLDLFHKSLGVIVERYFHHIPETLTTIISPKYDKIKININTIASEWVDTNSDFYDYAILDGIPVQLHVSFNADNGRRRHITISTLRIGDYPERLKKFLKKVITEVDDEMRLETKHTYMVDAYNSNITHVDSVSRNFNNVFIPDAIVNEITSSLDAFTKKRDWYDEHGIPYHFGIMLHGLAGMGKSSIAQAIASYMNADMYVLSGDSIMGLPKAIRIIDRDSVNYKSDFNIILVEDIDCGIHSDSMSNRLNKLMYMVSDSDDIPDSTSDKNRENDISHFGLASVLNALDGIGSPSNVIFIFTTNHIDALDPALIRPGRIDLSLEIKPVCLEAFGKFMRHHYGDDVYIPKNLSIKDGLSFASLQTLVMKGYTSKQMIDHVKKPSTKKEKYSSTPVKFGEIEPEEFAKLKKGKE